MLVILEWIRFTNPHPITLHIREMTFSSTLIFPFQYPFQRSEWAWILWTFSVKFYCAWWHLWQWMDDSSSSCCCHTRTDLAQILRSGKYLGLILIHSLITDSFTNNDFIFLIQSAIFITYMPGYFAWLTLMATDPPYFCPPMGPSGDAISI